MDSVQKKSPLNVWLIINSVPNNFMMVVQFRMRKNHLIGSSRKNLKTWKTTQKGDFAEESRLIASNSDLALQLLLCHVNKCYILGWRD